MTDTLTARRVAVLAQGENATTLGELFQVQLLRAWQFFPAETCNHARFLVQMDACDLLLVDDDALVLDRDDLGGLTHRPEVPVLFLSDADPEIVLHALTQGVRQWLPRPMTLAHPALLDAALRQALLARSASQRAQQKDDQLRDARAQVSRLVNLLWEALPAEGRPHWFGQRHMLARLHEEASRSQRHGTPLAVVLGEVWVEPEAVPPEKNALSPRVLSEWTVDRVSGSKRRSDIAGQYGLQGFMLLLPHTGSEGAAVYCSRLQRLLEQLAPVAPGRVHACFGIASSSPSAATPKGLLRLAEEDLEQARAVRSRIMCSSLRSEE